MPGRFALGVAIGTISAGFAVRPENSQLASELASLQRVSADYESRPKKSGCERYADTFPDDDDGPLGDRSHTTLMALHFYDNATDISIQTSRQWIFNFGPQSQANEHWIFEAHKGKTGEDEDQILFGSWGGRTFNSGQVKVASIHKSKTIATVYDTESKGYSLYVDGELVEKIILKRKGEGFNITSGEMNLGKPGAKRAKERHFAGCIYGANVYRRALTAAEMMQAHTEILAAVEGQSPDDATETEETASPPEDEAPVEPAPEPVPETASPPADEAPAEPAPEAVPKQASAYGFSLLGPLALLLHAAL